MINGLTGMNVDFEKGPGLFCENHYQQGDETERSPVIYLADTPYHNKICLCLPCAKLVAAEITRLIEENPS